jgi:phage gp45-like
MIGQIWTRLQLLFAQGVGLMVSDDKVQVRVLSDEPLNNIKRVEPYGYSYRPKAGCQPYLLFPAGDRSYGVAIVIADRRFQLVLEEGEVALHDDQGQKVHLKRDGVVVSTPMKCRIEAQDIVLHASRSYSWDVGGFGERWTALGGGQYEHKTWQTGAVVTTPGPLPINPPEGP